MRPSVDKTWCDMLQILRRRSTCLRRQTAALIVDKGNRLLSTGYNGNAPGFPHCNEGSPCYPEAKPGSLKSGDAGNEATLCQASHGEMAALVWLPDPRQGYALYSTNLCCFTCAKLVLQTNIEYVCAIEDYPDHRGLELLLKKPKLKVRVGNEIYEGWWDRGMYRISKRETEDRL
jgi:dCMP deaminase